MKKNILIIVSLVFIASLISCNQSRSEKIKNEHVDDITSQLNNIPLGNNIDLKEINIPYNSGPVSSLPWDKDINFKNAKIKNKTDILLAAYCTVLDDPLPGEQDNVGLASETIKGMVIQAGETFSQNNKIGPYTKEKGYKDGLAYIGSTVVPSTGGGVCKIATTLYNVSILSNLQIIERFNHGMPVSYVPYGQDAAVAYGLKDFKFKNNTGFPILIWSQLIKDRLYIGFYSNHSSPEIKWHHTILDTSKYSTEYKYNSDLKDGEEKVLLEGMDGATVESYISIEKSDGRIDKKSLGYSIYKPRPHVIETNNP